ncbi:hypothetical protein CLV53_11913 [Sediminibacterium magnilacihabitans]|nr:hypothetical protein CLV53_11913 [Sediminibacterium magnilacihabitans]
MYFFILFVQMVKIIKKPHKNLCGFAYLISLDPYSGILSRGGTFNSNPV